MGNGGFDCSGLVIHAFSRVLGKPVEAWPRELRHTRQMVAAAREIGDRICTLNQAYEEGIDTGLVYSWRWISGCWRIAHVSFLTGYNSDEAPIFLQAQAGYEAMVVERAPIEGSLRAGAPERLVLDPVALGLLALLT